MLKPRIMTTAAVLFCLGTVTFGQVGDSTSTRSFIEQTRSWQARWEGGVRNLRLDPEWVTGDRVVYRIDDGAGGVRFMMCDAGTGVVAPAFDHVVVAEQLGRLIGADIKSDRLPFARFAATGDALVAMLDPALIGAADHPIVTISEGEVRAAESLPEVFEARRVRQRSSGSGGATAIIMRNTTDAPVELFWLDGDGVARDYGKIAANTAVTRTTFEGHVWSVRIDGREIERVIGEARPTYLAITDSKGETPPSADDRAGGGGEQAPRIVLRDHNVFVVDADGERALTTDGTAEHGYGGRVWVSPGRSWVVVFKTRHAKTRTIHFIEARPDEQPEPRLHSMPYAKPGDPIDEPRPWVFDLSSGVGRTVDTSLITTPWSLSEVHWIDNERFRLLYNQRGHQVVRLVEFDVQTGGGRTVVEEASDTFVDYPNKVYHHRLADGNLLWMSQRTGWNHLYLLDGESGAVIRPLTDGEWLVRSVDQVDEKTGTVLLRVMGFHPDQDPYHHHFLRVEIKSGAVTPLTESDGTHSIDRSPDGRFYTARYERIDLPPVTELRRWSDGAKVATLAQADASDLIAKGWRPPERFKAKGRDGRTDIWGVIFKPTDFDPSQRYAVIENIYAGPHGQFVPKTWSIWHGHRELAERGFIVVQIDGMGTNWRSKAFHDVAHKNLGDSGFPDRIAWLRAAADDRPWMDLSRIGIYGGSAGGQSSTRALLAHGDFYSAAVSDCGCHDNRVDKLWWNELWMGYPIGPHYAEQSNVDQAKNLKGKLMLVVGEVDRNVDPASTMQVVDALIKADKDFELLVMPGVGHGAAENPYARRRRAEFFIRHLGRPAPAQEHRKAASGGG